MPERVESGAGTAGRRTGAVRAPAPAGRPGPGRCGRGRPGATTCSSTGTWRSSSPPGARSAVWPGTRSTGWSDRAGRLPVGDVRRERRSAACCSAPSWSCWWSCAGRAATPGRSSASVSSAGSRPSPRTPPRSGRCWTPRPHRYGPAVPGGERGRRRAGHGRRDRRRTARWPARRRARRRRGGRVTALLVAVGAAVGAPTRWWLDQHVRRRAGDGFPWGTLLINVVGSLVLGVLLGATSRPAERAARGAARHRVLRGVHHVQLVRVRDRPAGRGRGVRRARPPTSSSASASGWPRRSPAGASVGLA